MDPRRNLSGCMDMTAYEAIRNVSKEEWNERRVKKVLATIYNVCELAGFRVESRIVLKDKKTGKEWK